MLTLQLGEVCRTCESYNEPGIRVCRECGTPLASGEDMAPAGEAAAISVEGQEPQIQTMDTGEEAVASGTIGGAALPEAAITGAPEAEVDVPIEEEITEEGAPPGLEAQEPAYVYPPTARPPGFPPASARPPPTGKAAMVEGRPCSRCGSQNPPLARFCGSCGNPLVEGARPGAAPEGGRARLVLIRGSGYEGAVFRLNAPSCGAGREDGVIIFPGDPFLAPLHATFEYRDGALVVRDEGAANGLYVRIKEPVFLETGDCFVVGERLLRYAGEEAPQQPTPGMHGSPRAQGPLHRFEEVLRGGRSGRICKRAGPTITIGRVGCDMNFPTDGFVSSRHAEVTVAGGRVILRDNGSANGTYLRVTSGGEKNLEHGDYLLMGQQLLRVEIPRV
jgi:pSer/pThr/pTyr-binding forkhead associated (FHA) protein/ribosomal protein L40E